MPQNAMLGDSAVREQPLNTMSGKDANCCSDYPIDMAREKFVVIEKDVHPISVVVSVG